MPRLKRPAQLLVVTLALPAFALLVQHLLQRVTGIGSMGVLYPMAFLAAWYMPFPAASIVALLGSVGALWFFYEPYHSLTTHSSDHYVRIGIFLFNSFIVARIISRGRGADEELKASNARLHETNVQLSKLNSQLFESNAWYEGLGRATRDAIWNWNLVTGHVEWNEALELEYGHPPQPGRDTADWWLAHVHPDDRDRIAKSIHQVIDSGTEHWSDEYRFLKGDGSYAIILDRGFVTHDSQGIAVRMLGAMQDTTARNRALKDLQDLQLRFEEVSRATNLGVWYCDLPFDELQWNARVKEHFWMDPTQRVHIEDFFRHIHPEDREKTRQAIEGSIANGTPYDTEFRTVKPGHVKPSKRIRAIGWTVRDASGTPIRFDGITLDLTERYQQELERVSAQREVTDLLERTTDGFYTVDRNWRVAYANPVTQAFLQLPLRDILGKTIEELFPSPDRARFMSRYRRIAETGNAERFEAAYEGRTLQTHAYALGNRGVAVFYRDVTEQRRAEQAARQSEQQLREYADAMPDIAFIADGNGSIIYFNHRWYEYTGALVGSEGWGWKDLPIHHPDDLAPTLEKWTRAIRTGEPYETEYRLRRYDGKYRWHLGRAVASRDENGRVVRWYGTNTDIHDMWETKEALKHAISARDTFLSIASHELRTPITGMKLRTQLMRRKFHRGDESIFERPNVVKLVEQMDEGLDRMSRLVEDMLDISRIQSGRLRLEVAPIDLSAVVRDILSRFEAQLAHAEIAVEFASDGDLPVQGDRFRLEQVLTNLVTNAIRYAPGKPLRVRVDANGEKARIVMQDGGPGIPRADQERIFRRFERLVSADEISGLGIGLYIANEIVSAHHGTLRAEGEPGEGARFVVELPMN